MESNIFDAYIQTKSIFKKDRDILRPSYIPERLPHRDEEIKQLASILSTALRGERPSNVLLFGKTGTGKTATVNYLGLEIEKTRSKLSNISYIYMNCEIVDTQYGVLQNIQVGLQREYTTSLGKRSMRKKE
jgi:cell division control protein 6